MTTAGVTSAPRLLIVEDDTSLRDAMRAALSSAGYAVEVAADAVLADAAMAEFRPDLAILDVRLPGTHDGFAIATQIRAESGIPVLFVTAADALEDRLRGFDVGGDDYLVKPFPIAELIARVRAVLRRSGRLSSPTLEVRDLIIDEAANVAFRGGHELDLTPTEFSLLLTLARSPGTVFSKARLLSLVWGWQNYQRNLVEVHISALRRKLEAHGPRLIHTQRGAGYVLRQ